MNVPVEVTVSERGRKKICVEGYLFWKMRNRENQFYWECDMKCSKNCRATAKTVLRNGEHYLEYAKQHQHAPRESGLDVSDLINQVKVRAGTSREKPIQIIRNVTRETSPEIRSLLPKDKALSMIIHRERHQNTPIEPEDRHQFNVPAQYMTTIDGRVFCRDLNFPNFRILMFVTDNNIFKLSNAECWLIDGTFKTVPGIFKQLFTIHAKVGDTNGRVVPLFYALMTSKSERCYTQCFEELKALANGLNVNLRPAFFISDFEKASINAMLNVFPGVRSKCCHFHLAQIFWRRIQKLGLSKRYVEDRDYSLNLRHLLALAYLDENEIRGAIRRVALLIPPHSRELFKWFDKNYVRGHIQNRIRIPPRFEPRQWSVAENNNLGFPRTNNNVEAWHRKWLAVIGATHIGLFNIINHIKEEQNQNESIFI
jgi:hypothetical protein